MTSGLVWTRERPTVPGWWWLRVPFAEVHYVERLEPTLVQVVETHGTLRKGLTAYWPGKTDDDNQCAHATRTYAEWAGPIQPPAARPS